MSRKPWLRIVLLGSLAFLSLASAAFIGLVRAGDDRDERPIPDGEPGAERSSPEDPEDPKKPGDELLGKPAPSWKGVRWPGEPLSLEKLRGKVVLVRWWTRGCRYCVTSAPVLRELHEKRAEDGLAVVGIYHPKPFPRRVEDEEAKAWAERLEMEFPIGVDERWRALRRWWLDGERRRFTSVSFLLDREGRIRWIHPGGEYHPGDDPEHAACARSYEELLEMVEKLLKEEAPEGGEKGEVELEDGAEES